MRNILFFLTLFSFFTCACGQESFTIRGEISNLDKDYFIFAHDTAGFDLAVATDTIRLDKNGHFSIESTTLKGLALFDFSDTLRIYFPRFITKSFEISVDVKNVSNIKFTGEQAVMLQYYWDKEESWRKLYQEVNSKYPDFENMAGTELYWAIQDSIAQLRIDYAEKYFKNNSSQAIKDLLFDENISFKYSNLYYRLCGQEDNIIKHYAFYQKMTGIVDPGYIRYTDEVDFKDKKILSVYYFQSFIYDFILKAVRYNTPDSVPITYTYCLTGGIKIIDDLITNPEINSLQKLIFANSIIRHAIMFNSSIDLTELQIVIDDLKHNPDMEQYLPVIEKQRDQLGDLMSKLKKGSEIPDFTLEDLGGGTLKLSQFKGKLVCINVWASWCGKCKEAFTEWNKLVNDNSTYPNIAFLSVSLDEELVIWKRTLEKYPHKGIYCFAGTKGFQSSFAKEFNIHAIPLCIMIDQNGRLYTYTDPRDDVQRIINKYFAEMK